MARLIWAQQALDDLEQLLKFIAKDAPVAACRFAEKIVNRVEVLQEHPKLGGVIPEDDSGTYRQLVQGNYRIIYRSEGECVYLVAVHHAARLLNTEDLA
ncbi:type II toxin-antitoxin system RelE/ParE family toxin [Lacipirellula sp.]|uniref:type II toxin-antitoxin system RelE/ParE family toxin n=1 Tax=Lacipirellula sp. TaxID=2691419 RepID=UPI003D09962F